MRTDPGVVFVLFLVGVIVLTAIAYAVLLFARWNANRIRYVTPRYVSAQNDRAPDRRFSIGSEPLNLHEPALERRTDAFVLNLEECAAVARMIEHKTTAEKPTKASIIWAGFGLKKGASAKYQRASEIYDALFIIPPEPNPYPALAAQQRERWEPEKVA